MSAYRLPNRFHDNHYRDEQRIEPFVDALTEDVLLKEDGPPALGLVYHLAGTERCCERMQRQPNTCLRLQLDAPSC
jgi:hypothetical protein